MTALLSATPIKERKRAAAVALLRTRLFGDRPDRIYVPVAPVRPPAERYRVVTGPDTRALTGKVFGDPLPGQSALDRARNQP